MDQDKSKADLQDTAEVSSDKSSDSAAEIVLKPALQQLGTALCPVCNRRVAVFLTKTQRPFINCGFCSARIFYNGQASMRRLKKRMKPIKDQPIRIAKSDGDAGQ